MIQESKIFLTLWKTALLGLLDKENSLIFLQTPFSEELLWSHIQLYPQLFKNKEKKLKFQAIKKIL